MISYNDNLFFPHHLSSYVSSGLWKNGRIVEELVFVNRWLRPTWHWLTGFLAWFAQNMFKFTIRKRGNEWTWYIFMLKVSHTLTISVFLFPIFLTTLCRLPSPWDICSTKKSRKIIMTPLADPSVHAEKRIWLDLTLMIFGLFWFDIRKLRNHIQIIF